MLISNFGEVVMKCYVMYVHDLATTISELVLKMLATSVGPCTTCTRLANQLSADWLCCHHGPYDGIKATSSANLGTHWKTLPVFGVKR